MDAITFARSVDPRIWEMVRLMIDGTIVSSDHPVHGRCCKGEIGAIVIMPGEKNRCDLVVGVQVREMGRNSTSQFLPAHIIPASMVPTNERAEREV